MSFSNITNIYELLDEEGEEGVKRVAPAKTVAKPAPAKGTSSAPAKSSQQPSSSKPQSSGDNQRRGGEGRGERRDNRGGERREDRGPRNDNRPPRQQNDRAPAASGFGTSSGEGDNAQSGSVEFAKRGVGAPRYGNTRHDDNHRRGGAEGFGDRKRTYDRKSGTGRGNSIGREDKRQGGGRGNWGRNDGSEAVDAEEVAREGDAPSTDDVHGAEKAEERPETEEQKLKREEKEKEDKLITLEEYNRQREAKRKESGLLPQTFNVRQPNEGVDEKTAKKWGSLEQVKRDEDVKVTKPEGDAQRKDKKKPVQLELNFTVKDSQPRAPAEDRDDRRGGRGGRGGRGRGGNEGSRGRGGAQRGGERTERSERSDRRQQGGAEVNFSDPNSFPTLQ